MSLARILSKIRYFSKILIFLLPQFYRWIYRYTFNYLNIMGGVQILGVNLNVVI